MKRFYGCILFLLSLSTSSVAQILSVADGPWSDAGTWDCNCIPDAFSGQVTVSHSVGVSSSMDAPAIRIVSGGHVTVDAGVTVTLVEDFVNSPLLIESGGILTNNGTLDLYTQVFFTESAIYGSLRNFDTILAGEGFLHFYDGSTYLHAHPSGGDIPLGIWEKFSTVEISGLTAVSSVAPTNLDQQFGNFAWNTPGMTTSSVFSLGGQLTNVQGNLTFQASSRPIYLSSGTLGYDLTIAEDFVMQGGIVHLTRELTSNTTIACKNFTMTGGNLSFGVLNNDTVNLKVSGDFLKTAGSIAAGSGTGDRFITFSGSGVDQDYSVNSLTAHTLLSFVVEPNAVLNLGTTPIVTSNTSGKFILNGTVKLGSTDPLGAVTGNIPILGRIFGAGSKIYYNGSSPQFIGNAHPDPSVYPGVHTTINNAVSIAAGTNSVGIGGRLYLEGGDLTIGDNKTLILNGSLARSAGHSIVITPLSSITIGGSGAFGILFLSGTEINNFNLQRGSQTVTLGNDLKVNGTLTQGAGNLNYSGQILTIANNYSLGSPGGNLTGSESSTLIVTGVGTVSTLPLNGSIGVLEINRESGAANTTSVTVVNELRLLGGEFAGSGAVNLTPGIVVTRGDGSTTKTFTVSTYDLIYTNGAPINTGNEMIPSAVNNLTIEGNNTVTLHETDIASLTIRGTLTLNNGEFITNGKPIFIEGDFISNATGTFDGSLVTFSGNTTLSGATTITLGDVEIQNGATLNLGSTVDLSIAGNLNLQSGSVMVSGSRTTMFEGATTVTLPDELTFPRFNNLTISPGSSLAIVCTSCGSESNRPGLVLTGNWNSNTSGSVFNPAVNTTVRLEGSGSQDVSIGTSHSFQGLYFGGSGTATLLTNVRVLDDLRLEGSKNLSTGTGNRTIYIGDDFVFHGGTFTANLGTVVFNGSGVQVIDKLSGTVTPEFYNITIEQSGGSFAIEANVNLKNVFTISSASAGALVDFDGATTTTGDNVFTLLSSATRTASIAAIPNPSIVYGSITAQRFMSGGEGKIYRYISSPVENATVADLQNEIPVTGDFTGTSFPCAGCINNNATMFWLNESNTGVALNYRYENFPASTNTENFEEGRGYAVYVREGTAPTTWNLRGTVNKGQQPLPVSYSGSGSDDGWNLVGNPYPSAIDWLVADGASSWTRTSIDPTIYLWDESIGNYATYNRTIGTEGQGTFGGSRYIAAGQAFWVKATAPGASLVAREGVKANQGTTQFLRQMPASDILRITLLAEGRERDQTLIVGNVQGATDGYDLSIDSHKLYGPTLNLYSFTEDNRALAINALGGMACSKEVKLAMTGTLPGHYGIRFDQLESFSNPADMYLVDQFTGESFSISASNSVYEFEVLEDSASFGVERFKILFSRQEIDTKLTAEAPQVCAGTDARIDLLSSQRDIEYYVAFNGTQISETVAGTGGSIALMVPQRELAVGENRFAIMAMPAGCAAVPLENSVIVRQEAMPSVSKVDNGVSCNGSSVTLKAYGTPAGATYNWYETNDAEQPIEGETSETLQLDGLQKSKTYYVSIKNALGCEGERVEVKANVNIFAGAEIKIIDGVLVSNHGSGNQWYLDGEAIEGATQEHFTAVHSGLYRLDVTVGTCVTSTELDYVVTSTEDPNLVGVDIYPNPVVDRITINVNSSADVNLNIYNALGVKVIDAMPLTVTGNNSRSAEIDFTGRVSGFYLVEILDGEKIKRKKILKK